MNIVSHKAEHKQNRGSEAINFILISNFSLHFPERRLISVLSRLCKSVEWSSNTNRILQLTLSTDTLFFTRNKHQTFTSKN